MLRPGVFDHHQLAGCRILKLSAKGIVELVPVVPLAPPRPKAIAFFDNTLVLHLLGGFQQVLESKLTTLDLVRQAVNVGVRPAQFFQSGFGPEHGPGFGILRDRPALALVLGGFPQRGDDVVCYGGVLLDQVVEGEEVAIITPVSGIFVTGEDDVGTGLGFESEERFLFVIRPAGGVNGGFDLNGSLAA